MNIIEQKHYHHQQLTYLDKYQNDCARLCLLNIIKTVFSNLHRSVHQFTINHLQVVFQLSLDESIIQGQTTLKQYTKLEIYMLSN
ncbi:hypothetical protein pb186bvf_015862 [Paramecium bursaria]